MGLGFVVRDELTKAVVGFIVESVLKTPVKHVSVLPKNLSQTR